MLDANITEYVNGFSVTVYEPGTGFLVREVTDTRLEALKALESTVRTLLQKERDAIVTAAMMQ